MMSNAVLVTAVKPVALAVSVYPVPVLLRLKSKNVATPLTAVTGVVPPSVAPPGLLPSATLTLPAKLVARLPSASSARTFTAGVMRRFATVVTGCWLNASWVAVPGVMLKTLLVAVFKPVALAVSQ